MEVWNFMFGSKMCNMEKYVIFVNAIVSVEMKMMCLNNYKLMGQNDLTTD